MSESRVDLDAVIIIPVDTGRRQLGFTCSSCSTVEKAATTQLQHSQTRDTCTGHPQPWRQEVTENPLHSSPPQGHQDNSAMNYSNWSVLLPGTVKACRGQQVRNIKKEGTNQKWKQKKSKIFICRRNVNWLTNNRKGCWSLTPSAETLQLIHLISDKGRLIHDLSLKQRSIFPKHDNSGVQIWNCVTNIWNTVTLLKLTIKGYFIGSKIHILF